MKCFLPRVEKLATFLGIGTSLATLVVSVVEIPRAPTSLDLWLALTISLLVSVIFVVYWVRAGKKTTHPRNELQSKHRTEEKRLRTEFPSIFTFIESVGEIRNQKDFDQFVTRLDHLLEIERRARGIKWSELKDIEAMKAIAYARLIAKKREYQ